MHPLVKKARNHLRKITPAPWGTDGELIGSELTIDGPGITSYRYGIANMNTDDYAEEDALDGESYGDDEPWRPYDQMLADAKFIAAAPTLVKRLAKALDQAGDDIARQIWDEEQRLQAVINDDPLNTHLHGIMRGLHIARDVAKGERPMDIGGH